MMIIKDFDIYWSKLKTKYNDELDYWVNNDVEFEEAFLNDLQENIHPHMTKRAEESGQDYIYATNSWGNFNKLNEIPVSKLNLTEQKMAILQILYCYHYWSWCSRNEGRVRRYQERWFFDVFEIMEQYV